MQMKRLAVLQSKCSFYLYQLKLLKIRSIIAVLSQKIEKIPIAVQPQGFGLQWVYQQNGSAHIGALPFCIGGR